MVFFSVNKNNDFELSKPIQTFLFLALAVGMGVMLFTLLLYGLIQAVTSSGFSELKASDEDDDRERIDDNDELEDV